MMELIHTFTSGRMNKDLDERLVPNGEYRDALNLEISTSDTGNVGALQNIKGNTPKPYKSLNPVTNVYTPWTIGYIDSLAAPIKVGEIANPVTETIYWFIASDGISAIAEYDQTTDVVTPLLVDDQGILNFSESYLITGINIIEDLLFWTDNQTEPKVINVKDFKLASVDSNFQTHTVFNGRPFVESDITVIKKAPIQPLDLELSNTRAVDSNGDPAIVTATTQQNFVKADPGAPNNCVTPICRVPFSIGDPLRLNWVSSPYPFFKIGDILTLEGSAVNDDNFENEYEIRVEITAVSPGSTQTYADVKVLVVPINVLDQIITWSVSLDESVFFEFKFPRFAYRYKYKDGYYSSFSPFTKVAFLAGEFDYETKKGYNLGMVNNLKQCVIKGFSKSSTPIDVVEVDLLYKESNSTSIYVVDTFIKDDDIWNANEFNIESEIISSILPANQLFRSYDNVPRIAKAQEITGNRLLYGNYLQNFNLINNLGTQVSPSISQSILHNSNWDCNYSTGSCVHTKSTAGEVIPKTPFPSIKSQRTYQTGVVFQDKYGRQTPVFTSESASTKLPKKAAVDYNQITVQADGNVPLDFTGFRYYIKETSNEYYNLAMDRWYDAEDGNVWISFPSAERNKVDESTFLELKKSHNKDEFVPVAAKYKVIAISNEAPLFLKKVIKVAGSVDGSGSFDDINLPLVDTTSFDILKSALDDSSAATILDSTQLQRIVRIFTTSVRSNYYNVTSISLITGSTEYYRVSIEGKFGEDVSFTTNPDGSKASDLNAQFATEDFENKPEFEGRFFIKLYKDITLENFILSTANSNSYGIVQGLQLGFINGTLYESYVTSTWGGAGWAVDQGPIAFGSNVPATVPYTVGGNQITIAFTGIWKKGPNYGVGEGSDIYPQFREAVAILNSVGGLFRFAEDPDQVIYRITSSKSIGGLKNYQDNSKKESYDIGSNKRRRWVLKVTPIDSATNGTGLFQGPSGWVFPKNSPSGVRPPADPGSPTIEFLTVIPDANTFTSNNPGIFETEPKESAELDLYYAASGVYPISEYGEAHVLDWHNCISFGNGVESDRIRDDYNAVTIDNGAIVSATLKEPYAEERRPTGLIFSQIFNSTSGINSLNQFIQAEAITKDLNPVYSSIQKLHSRDTNVVALCEDKCLKILANKDALFNADGSANVTSNSAVLGQAIPFAGEYGISKHPESFATYGFRMYFTDRNRGVVLRLSNDGLEDVSRYGMGDFFSDNLKVANTTWGSFDSDKGSYNLGLSNLTTEWQGKFQDQIKIGTDWTVSSNPSSVISFKEQSKGWEGRKSFGLHGGISLNDRYYTFNNASMWEHRTEDAIRNNFYGAQYDSSVDFLINDMPNVVKKYKTLNYSGSKSREYAYGNSQYSNLTLAQVEALQLQTVTSETLVNEGWYAPYVNTDLQEGYIKQFIDKENKYFQYIKGVGTYFTNNTDNNLDSKEFPMQGIGRATIVNAPNVTVFNVNLFGEPDCAVYIQQPIADPKTYSVLEDCTSCTSLLLTGSDPQGYALTYELVDDNLLNGTLSSIDANNQVVFTPNVLNYYGGAGSFTYRTFNGVRYSEPAQVDVSIVSVLEGPSINSTPPAGPFQEGDPYSWTNITATDPDHDITELTWSTEDLPPTLTLTTSGPNNTGIATITGTVPAGTLTYTLKVVDPDGLEDTLDIGLTGLAELLVNLDFVAYATQAAPATTWTNPNDPNEVVSMAARGSSAHGCNRGTYRLVANKQIDGGVVIGRFYVGNVGGLGLNDSYGWDGENGVPTSGTGDVKQASGKPPSAENQGNIDGLGNVTNAKYTVTDLAWGSDPNNSLQRYVTSGSTSSYDRYSFLQITENDATNIATNFADTTNPSYVTFTFEPDSYEVGTALFNTHGDSVWFQVVQKNATTEEIFSGPLGTPQGQCDSNTAPSGGKALGVGTCDPAFFQTVAFDLNTGAYLPNYDPLNP